MEIKLRKITTKFLFNFFLSLIKNTSKNKKEGKKIMLLSKFILDLEKIYTQNLEEKLT